MQVECKPLKYGYILRVSSFARVVAMFETSKVTEVRVEHLGDIAKHKCNYVKLTIVAYSRDSIFGLQRHEERSTIETRSKGAVYSGCQRISEQKEAEGL